VTVTMTAVLCKEENAAACATVKHLVKRCVVVCVCVRERESESVRETAAVGP
jgi:hypothetical protein